MPGWRRTLTITAFAQVLSILGFSFVVPFLPLYLQKLGVHGVSSVTLWAAIMSGGTALGMTIASPIWGVLADRHGRKIMVVRAMFSAALIIGLMAFVQNVYQLLILRTVQGMFTGTVSAAQALVASQSPRERMGFSLGVMQTSVFVGNAMGPVIGGLVAEQLGFRHSFFISGLILMTGGVVVSLFVHEEMVAVEHRPARGGFFKGLGEALHAPMLLSMIAAIFTVQFAVTVIYPVLPQFVQYLQGPGGHAAAATGLILTSVGAAGALSSLLTGWLSDHMDYRTILIVASLAAAALEVPQYFVNATWQLLILRVGVGLALGAMLPSASAMVASLVPAERRGTAYGLMASANAMGFAAGPLTAAGVVAAINIRAVFPTAAVLLVVIAIWVAAMVRIPDHMESDTASVKGASELPA
ncbi:MAG: MFS transporter [Chloroflexota bacterium]